MDRHVINTLLCLVFDHVQEVLCTHVFDVAPQLFQHLINRHRADRNGRCRNDLAADIVDVLASRQIHDSVGTVVHRYMKFF